MPGGSVKGWRLQSGTVEVSVTMSAQTESNETLSALLDGEVAGAELDRLLRELDSSEALRERWRRECVVRAARDGVRVRPGLDLCAGVMSAIADAPAPARDSKVVAIPQRAAGPARPAPFPATGRATIGWLPAVGMAAAASLVAVVAVTSIRSGNRPGTAAQVALTPTPAVEVQPAAYTQTAAAQTATLDDDAQRQLDNLVIEHANYRGGGVGGALGYARYAVHTADFQPADGQH
jgi:negative regulator of sigma E activity